MIAEMRLIDANAEAGWAMENLPEPHSGVVIQFLRDSGTIDPETLPIVRELRDENIKAECRADALMSKILVLEEQLAQVTAERDALKKSPPVQIDADSFELAAELARVTAERDAAQKDIETAMEISEHEAPGMLCVFCAKNDTCVKCDGPKWCGPQREDANE